MTDAARQRGQLVAEVRGQEPIAPRRPTVLDPTRARPEPWFVGNGKGLMIGVLTLCALLTVLRIASAWWMAQEAWHWWQEDQGTSALTPLPSRRVPATDPRLASAKLHGNPATAFGPDMYPQAAMMAGEQGRTVARLLIDRSGTPRRCIVTTSSGSRTLDDATCQIALARVRFDPARDARGAPIASAYILPVRWVLPDG